MGGGTTLTVYISQLPMGISTLKFIIRRVLRVKPSLRNLVLANSGQNLIYGSLSGTSVDEGEGKGESVATPSHHLFLSL